ncbi:GNAT family N-acetyltransferase [Streptomyces pinistramenti]|uniref:GNAT family N-acetyltransferase n=1 Tax=Streptomyces pinistramenti TaxID=2884812 RepID=UPI001D07E702|nr:GNAT family N-acetyltransferase [Streptomyces pinistramenti]MCB5906280.1 GNAT family N-acetyltransferase [Streptomyces pinistramenti]
MRRTETYRTRVVRTVEDLAPETEELASAAGASEFYYGHEFLRAYEREPIQPVHAVYYIEVLDHDDRVIGLTPCYVQGDPLRALGLAADEKALLSHVWHCSDTQLASTRTGPEVARAVVAEMRRIAADEGLSRCGFINVATGSPTALALEAAGLTGTDLDTRYTVDLAAVGNWDGYLASLRYNARREYARQLRRADDCGVQVSEREPQENEDPETLRIFEALMANVGSAGYYSKERIAAFLRYTRKGARIIEVTQDGALIAKAVVFIESKKIHAWAGGYDRHADEASGRPFSSYYVLMSAIIKLGLRIGVPTLEGGRRNGHFKIRYGMRPQELMAFMTDVAG